MRPKKIISGGQNGADLAGLQAAKFLGIETGGTAPKGWKVEEFDGTTSSNPGLAKFGLIESSSPSYAVRTIQNVKESDGTVWFGFADSPGGRLTIGTAARLKKPMFINPTPQELAEWVKRNEIKILNVAGNRVSKFNPEIFETTYKTIVEAFSLEFVLEFTDDD